MTTSLSDDVGGASDNATLLSVLDGLAEGGFSAHLSAEPDADFLNALG
ncbi:MAG TPA: hypothetical protein VMM60_02475 [Ilumatobacter sp.]|nr:hypothetical protein [Ilumatobacter sp.]